ncbi:protein phosphatase 2C domain-containing protein [Streptomyces sp. NPDC048057]|uniref:protein phosphatase 2C domain-containing protein n=1 Tax=Streptomyces sp. NPDC048057 TaxID=3155628 RepID=UPI0033FA45F0
MSSQNEQPTGAVSCPGCGEAVEIEDRFCGRCGAGLPRAAGRPPGSDRPTLPINTAAHRLPPQVTPSSPGAGAAQPAPAASATSSYARPAGAGGPAAYPQGDPVSAAVGGARGTGTGGGAGDPSVAGAAGAAEPVRPRSRLAALADLAGPPRDPSAPSAWDVLPDAPGRVPAAQYAPAGGAGVSGGSDVPSFDPEYGQAPLPDAAVEADVRPRAEAGEGPPQRSGGDYELQQPSPEPSDAGEPVPHQPSSGTGQPPQPPSPDGPDPRAEGTAWCVACRAGRVDTDGYCENCGHAQPRERDHLEQELGPLAAVSDRGLRHHRNEDAFAISTATLSDGSPAVVAIVCDGVSSATRPDEASQAASRAACDALTAALPRGVHPEQAMREAIVDAAAAVNALAAPAPGGDALDQDQHRQQNAPACTVVGAVSAGGLLIVGWVGDSRAYWVPDDRGAPAARLTEDDSWAAQMVAAGLMSEAEAYADERAHAITGWLGADAYELDPHTAVFRPDRSGVVVVCTDGLWNYAEGADDMAAAVPRDAAERPLHGARVLVGHALDGGGHDNVTVAVLPISVEP